MKPKVFDRIYVEITNICNLRCSFCPETKRKKETMTLDNFNKVIDKIKDYVKTIYLHVKGEPLMHPDIDKILQRCFEENIRVIITTNGTLIYKVKEIIGKYDNIAQINISIHSAEQNRFEEIDKYILDICKSVEYINSKLTKNIFSLRFWNNIEFEEQNKVNRYCIEKILEYFKKEIEEDKYTLKSIKLKERAYINQSNSFKWPDEKEIIGNSDNIGNCLGARTQLGILVDGTVIPCCLDNNGSIKLGNIFEQNMEEILSNNRYISMRKGFENNVIVEELCKTCGYRKKFKIKNVDKIKRI